METFDFPVHAKLTGNINFKTISTTFGDGYVQETVEGLNNISEAWNITTSGEYVLEVKSFLDTHQGYKAFKWTTPLGEEKLFKCRKGYSLTHINGDLFSLSTRLEEVFTP